MSALCITVLAAVLAATPEGDASSVEPEQIRRAIRLSIPYVEERGNWWIEEKKCVSCHRVGSMVWSLSAAEKRGFEISDRLGQWSDWAVEQSLSENDAGKIVGAGNREGVAQLLLAPGPENVDAERSERERQLAKVIADGLEPDGSWKSGGQLPGQKRPSAETADVSGMWLALTLAEREFDNLRPEHWRQALARIASSEPGESTEWYAARLLLALQLDDQPTVSAMVEALRDQQDTDGGWGWIVGDPSDALGTGMALYALLQAKAPSDDVALRKALRFLIDTQRDDGSWAVRGTKAKKKDQVEETAVYWGTTWALLALTESLPD